MKVIMKDGREYGGINELYQTGHLVGLIKRNEKGEIMPHVYVPTADIREAIPE